MKDEIMNSFILSFDNNNDGIINVYDGETSVSGMLYQLTDGSAKYLGRDEKGRIEIAISIKVFLEIKDNPVFAGLCVNLSRLRRTNMDLITFLCYPWIYRIDNELTKEQKEKIINNLEYRKQI